MLLQRLEVPPLAVNCYLIGCRATGEGAVIDPGGDADGILKAAASHQLTISAILQTHGHLDHMTATRALSQATGAPVYAHQGDHEALLRPDPTFAAMLGLSVQPPERLESLGDGDVLTVGRLSLEVMATPGHSPGSVCYLVGGDLFTGDTLFAGGVGRTDLPGGDHDQLIRSLRDRLLPLPDDLAVHPGHGPTTNLGDQKRNNPWLLEARGYDANA
ncbi:MAG: MBL fold metallo-hydrolase [Armatimonadota bacterium]